MEEEAYLLYWNYEATMNKLRVSFKYLIAGPNNLVFANKS